MTCTSTSAPSAHVSDNLHKLSDLGAQLGSLIRRVSYLAIAISEAADSVPTHDKDSREALDRAMVFNGLVEEATARALILAEEIETIGLQSRDLLTREA